MTKTTSKLLLSARASVKRGEFENARQIYQDVLTRFPSNASALAGRAALEKAARAVPRAPSAADMARLINLYRKRAFADVVRHTQYLLVSHPDVEALYNILGAAHLQQANPDGAIAAFSKAASLQPDNPEAHFNLGTALKAKGAHAAAIRSFEAAIALRPDHAESFNNMANSQQDMGDLAAATQSYTKALALKPDYPEAHRNLANTYRKSGLKEQALTHFARAIELQPDYAQAHHDMGIVHQEKGNLDEAALCFRRGLSLQPNFIACFQSLCGLYERSNNLGALELLLSANPSDTIRNQPQIVLYDALLKFRQNDFIACQSYLEKIPYQQLTQIKQQTFHNLQGRCHDKLGQFPEAFAGFSRMNDAVIGTATFVAQRPDAYFELEQQKLAAMRSVAKTPRPAPRAPGQDPAPTFLIGFPRSGTTLLDTILRSHSRISVLEEEPMMKNVIDHFGADKSIIDIEMLEDSEIEELRSLYLTVLSTLLPVQSGTCVIDKLPLNILQVPLIHALFPRARFILALRHPLDCVLSCFMQTFSLNPAMANMVRIERIAQYYCIAMEQLSLAQSRFEIELHTLRYESLVINMQEEVAPLLSFLGLEWEDTLKSYTKTAQARGLIGTPSYSQVIQPLYADATDRWRNYEKELSPVFDMLRPWIKTHGYTL
jgi:tetratricopeptide (TPR) repeat protein